MIYKLLFLAIISGQFFVNKTLAQTSMGQASTSEKTGTLYDQAYGNDKWQKMDIYMPNTRNDSTVVMIIVHGGAWVRGDKSEFNPYVAALQKLLPNYAFVNINYRLFRNGKNGFPAQEEDMKSAVLYLEKRLEELGLPKRIVLLGASAGGHLALLQAYKNSGTIKPAAVISLFAPTDMLDMYNNSSNPDVAPMLSELLGTTPAEDPGVYRRSSPVEYVTASSPPTLLLQGGRDRMVHEEQAKILQKKLDSLKVINELKIYPDEGHGWTGPALFDSFVRVASFLKRNAR
ncbi:alpha/beta hydrolase fold domain-containing protein [Flavitalea sp.]|nr:alpha/beta hydrolase [Flavitalea sp.]